MEQEIVFFCVTKRRQIKRMCCFDDVSHSQIKNLENDHD